MFCLQLRRLCNRMLSTTPNFLFFSNVEMLTWRQLNLAVSRPCCLWNKCLRKSHILYKRLYRQTNVIKVLKMRNFINVYTYTIRNAFKTAFVQNFSLYKTLLRSTSNKLLYYRKCNRNMFPINLFICSSLRARIWVWKRLFSYI